ncbi:hypothetical protein HK099_006017 [Clydaea vesicula]|uniref:Uncharacterized protein n=1 Tax=Clydaea vesicula TaxID=447962 RepID=A0AAD5U0C5_9FUNG|nr:hypothetical protein HK099_006017 [Clydaea vesicula]
MSNRINRDENGFFSASPTNLVSNPLATLLSQQQQRPSTSSSREKVVNNRDRSNSRQRAGSSDDHNYREPSQNSLATRSQTTRNPPTQSLSTTSGTQLYNDFMKDLNELTETTSSTVNINSNNRTTANSNPSRTTTNARQALRQTDTRQATDSNENFSRSQTQIRTRQLEETNSEESGQRRYQRDNDSLSRTSTKNIRSESTDNEVKRSQTRNMREERRVNNFGSSPQEDSILSRGGLSRNNSRELDSSNSRSKISNSANTLDALLNSDEFLNRNQSSRERRPSVKSPINISTENLDLGNMKIRKPSAESNSIRENLSRDREVKDKNFRDGENLPRETNFRVGSSREPSLREASPRDSEGKRSRPFSEKTAAVGNERGRYERKSATSESRFERAGEERRIRTTEERIAERGARENRSASRTRTAPVTNGSVASQPREEDHTPVVSAPVDESIIVKEYILALMKTLELDQVPTPDPDDFISSDGFSIWQQSIGTSIQGVLCEILENKFITQKEEAEMNKKRKEKEKEKEKAKEKESGVVVNLFFKIVEARGLLAKDNKTRDAYCFIEFGDLNNKEKKKDKDLGKEGFKTQVVNDTNNPIWNQHINIPVKNLTDTVSVNCWDQKKDDFLGNVKLSIGELISTGAKGGYQRRWCNLLPKDEKKKDKYVGGEILIEFCVDNTKPAIAGQSNTAVERMNNIQAQLLQCKINFKSMYKVLLRNCLELDMLSQQSTINDRTTELQTDESKATLEVLGNQWAVGDAFKIIALLELLFEKYKQYLIPYNALMRCMEEVHIRRKKTGWLGLEKNSLLDLLEEMYSYSQTQVTKYKEFYPKNKPSGGLSTTILFMRMIYKNPVYVDAHPEMPVSFKETLKSVMTNAAVSRYQKLQELCSPFDESDVDGVIEGLLKFAEMLSDEIEADTNYYKKAFKGEINIDQLTAENYLKLFVLTLESNYEIIASDEAVEKASKNVFALYRKVKFMDEKFGKLIPGLKRLSMSAGFNVEKWFSPFVLKWLDNLSKRTLEWVTNAVKADNFEPLPNSEEVEDDNDIKHSSSVTDLFSAVYSELEFIADLQWSNTVNKAIEQYCDAIASGEIRVEKETQTWTNLATSFARPSSSGPTDITLNSCVKLCNIQFAMQKLEEMYRTMQVESLTKNVKNYRATMQLPKHRNQASSNKVDDDLLSGQIKVQIAYVENVKPCNKNGLANPYAVIRVPEGTVVPVVVEEEVPGFLTERPNSLVSNSSNNSIDKDKGPTILNGKDCELARSRAIYDSLNVTWDETFQCILPPVNQLEVLVNSKNLVIFDELCGKSTIDLSKNTKLRRNLMDHQTHDVYVNLEPQGRLLIRLTLEGEEEDVDFWFRRSRERLGRTRDDFVRALTAKIAPNAGDILIKVFKDNEAVPLPAKSYFSSLITAVQYSDLTASGKSIDQRLSEDEAHQAISPITVYLNKNLSTLFESLSTRMAQEVIKRTWDEILIVIEQLLVAPLYGQIERERRVLNIRQISVSEWAISILKTFFNDNGSGMGIPHKILESRNYRDLMSIISQYHMDLPRVRREYELSLLGNREKELLLKLARLRFEKDENMPAPEKEENRKWFDTQLALRKERNRRSNIS